MMNRRMKRDICFVILHYNVFEETCNTVKSIIDKIDTSSYHIIIVDNGSLNESGTFLINEYKDNKKVTIVTSTCNLGFAKGNNLGYKFTLEYYDSKFICVLNNDIILKTKNFYSLVKKEYEFSGFAVLGPKIILKDNSLTSLRRNFPSLKSLKKTQVYFEKKLCSIMSGKSEPRIQIKKIVRKYLFRLKRYDNKMSNSFLLERHENILLHGSFLIFSDKYYDKFDKEAFDSRTFLFREEELLYIRCQTNNLKMIYNPEIEIIHLEDAATNSILKSDKEKELFLYKNQVQSLSILIGELESLKKNGINIF